MSEILDKHTIKALSTDTRQEIMKMLAKRPYTASEIARVMRKHVTTVTEHLGTLESTGLVKKKESTNKWVYYALTDKGERLFKPQFYSWVIVFSLSAVFIFVGTLRLLRFETVEYAGRSEALKAPALDATVAPVDYAAYGLIVLGLIGLAYLLYTRHMKKS